VVSGVAGNLATMPNAKRRARAAAETVAVSDEQVLDVGVVWAAPVTPGSGLLFRARHQYLIALTDRRLLVFERRARRRRDPVGTADLVMGKRYEFFTVDRRRRYPTLSQLVLRGENDTGLVLEFRPPHQALGRALEQHLTAPGSATVLAGVRGRGEDSDVPASPEDAERAAAEAFWGNH
jgi:hypothetical protein